MEKLKELFKEHKIKAIKLKTNLQDSKKYGSLTFLEGMGTSKIMSVEYQYSDDLTVYAENYLYYSLEMVYKIFWDDFYIQLKPDLKEHEVREDIHYFEELMAEAKSKKVKVKWSMPTPSGHIIHMCDFSFGHFLVEDSMVLYKEVKKPQVYIAGDMLTGGSQLLRAKEKEDIESLGFRIYNPQDNEDINDKQAQGNSDDLAERIVYQDTAALFESDIITIEPQPYAQGTLVELGQLKGMRDMANVILSMVADGESIKDIVDECTLQVNKKILPHYEDIRRHNDPEVGDRRSLGINAYVYGTCLDLSKGKGFYTWEEIKENLGEE